jgi:WD40 repeat protein
MRRNGWLLATSVLLSGATVRGEERPRRLPHEGPVFGVVFAPDGRTLFSGGDDRTVRAWDVRTGKELRRFEGHKGGVLALALTADGKTLASAGRDKTVRLWNTQTGKELHRLETSLGDVEGLALSADGKLLAASTDGRSGSFRTALDGLVLG